eukprot:scaffold15232_cov115-Isochrysis_galbana.AAC.9
MSYIDLKWYTRRPGCIRGEATQCAWLQLTCKSRSDGCAPRRLVVEGEQRTAQRHTWKPRWPTRSCGPDVQRPHGAPLPPLPSLHNLDLAAALDDDRHPSLARMMPDRLDGLDNVLAWDGQWGDQREEKRGREGGAGGWGRGRSLS